MINGYNDFDKFNNEMTSELKDILYAYWKDGYYAGIKKASHINIKNIYNYIQYAIKSSEDNYIIFDRMFLDGKITKEEHEFIEFNYEILLEMFGNEK